MMLLEVVLENLSMKMIQEMLLKITLERNIQKQQKSKVHIQVNGKMEKEMDLAYYVGEMNQNFQGFFQKTKLQDMVSYGMRMVIHIKENGKIFKPKDGEFIILKKVHIFVENGQMISKMDLELKNGPEVVLFLEIIQEGIKMGQECLILRVKHGMKENLKMELFLGLVLLYLKMVEDMKECGKIIKWMDME